MFTSSNLSAGRWAFMLSKSEGFSFQLLENTYMHLSHWSWSRVKEALSGSGSTSSYLHRTYASSVFVLPSVFDLMFSTGMVEHLKCIFFLTLLSNVVVCVISILWMEKQCSHIQENLLEYLQNHITPPSLKASISFITCSAMNSETVENEWSGLALFLKTSLFINPLGKNFMLRTLIQVTRLIHKPNYVSP